VEDHRGNDREEIFSKRVKAGKRTYFFDVKSTKSNDYYLTITESKRRLQGDTFVFEKHKIFLYKEDFDKFIEGLQEAIDHIKVNYPDSGNNYRDFRRENDQPKEGSSGLEFDDLGK
jgi:hypothetical protein